MESGSNASKRKSKIDEFFSPKTPKLDGVSGIIYFDMYRTNN